jgi:hypothetical protein
MTSDAERRNAQRAPGRIRRAATLRPYVRCAACEERTTGRTAVTNPAGEHPTGDQTAHDRHLTPQALPADDLLNAITRMFDTHILGADRPRLIALCLDITAAPTANNRTGVGTAAPGRPAHLPSGLRRLAVDLAVLPSHRLRRLLDAFAIQIHYDPQRPSARLAVRVSTLLHPQLATDTGLGVEIPDGWPVLTPQAARALLRLLVHVAYAREKAAPQMRSVA